MTAGDGGEELVLDQGIRREGSGRKKYGTVGRGCSGVWDMTYKAGGKDRQLYVLGHTISGTYETEVWSRR